MSEFTKLMHLTIQDPGVMIVFLENARNYNVVQYYIRH